ncbi:MAG TPA: imidazoleglycerol-phosphate dehydratase HisB [Desulfurivibrio alkaliphilus]|uniref:Imidazoleglycerol-phosphate dehydratase n=1 Tax=Desulfurivibrio alkaliphilus TaxID=427923 RepID=A0A7C2XQC4_9BACT|nr:imidazoleglycerol-phosphate dehydratase HisB [Desulfurivibrio alkaliphilus]
MSAQTRCGEIQRRTKETDIKLALTLDGRGATSINTGVGFMDHMLTLMAVHGFFNLEISASGDTEVDDHHTVEDLGIALGQALKQALGDLAGISRYGEAAVPMDEALVRVTLDCSNRPFLHYGITVPDAKVGSFDTALAKEFLRAFALHGGLTLHLEMAHGENSHHILEATFKALGRALDQATRPDQRLQGALSSKGSL